jgi:organic radical activating enzyme
MNNIFISEIFGPTIQGEGSRAGRLSLFIRVGLCNFSCQGFGVKYSVNDEVKYGCDSYYSVDSTFKNSWQKLSCDDILGRLQALSKHQNIDIVITGGEPLLYWENKEFQKLLKILHKNNHHITIETNGSIPINLTKKYQKNIMFSIGLKLKNSGERKSTRFNIKALNILLNNQNSYLKIVTDGSKKDLQQIKKNISRLDNPTVYLMPLSDDKKSLKINAKKVIKQAIKYNFNYSDRLHIRLWGDKRGV